MLSRFNLIINYVAYRYYYYVFPKTCVDFSPSVYGFQRHPRLHKLHFNSEHFRFEYDMLDNLATNHSEFYILVDLSLNLDIHSSSTTTFDHILVSFEYKQHISISTKIHGHLRCLVINRSN